MGHGKKLLFIIAVICTVAGIGCAAWMSVSAWHPHRGAGLGTWWEEEEPEAESWEEEEEISEEEDILEPEEEPETADSGGEDSPEEDQTMYGVLEERCYKNEWFNIKMELPENYILLSGDELGMAQDVAGQYMTEEGQERLENALDYGSVRYVMAAVEDMGGVSVNIGIERVFKSMTIEQYLNLLQKNIEKDITEELSFAIEGITEENIAGETYQCVHEKMIYDASMGEIRMDQYIRLEDGYVFVMSVGYSSDSAAQKDALLSVIQSCQ